MTQARSAVAKTTGGTAIGALAVGAVAFGAMAIGALAVGAMTVRRLKILEARIEHLSIGSNPPDEVNVVIEVPIGGEPIKYEIDKKAGMLVVDRFLYTPMRYPGNYGFIPHTLSEDGDPCDVLVANTRPIIPGAAIAVRPVGVLLMTDEAGGDEKLIAVPSTKLTKRYFDIQDHVIDTKKKWFKKMSKELSARTTARFFQIDNKLAKLPRNAKPDWHTKLKEQAKREWSEGQLTYE